jgi:hypothetical protein
MTLALGARITGLKEARALIGKIAQGAAAWQRTRIGAGSHVPYAHWIEKGFYFSGRPGQTRAVRYIERAMADILPTIGPRILAALPQGGPAVSAEADKISGELVARAQQYVTVRSGRLRDSISPNRGQSLRGM